MDLCTILRSEETAGNLAGNVAPEENKMVKAREKKTSSRGSRVCVEEKRRGGGRPIERREEQALVTRVPVLLSGDGNDGDREDSTLKVEREAEEGQKGGDDHATDEESQLVVKKWTPGYDEDENGPGEVAGRTGANGET